MKVATRRFSALLALSKVLTEGPHGLREKVLKNGITLKLDRLFLKIKEGTQFIL